MSTPRNHMKNWTAEDYAEDYAELQRRYASGNGVQVLAEHFGRTDVSILCKLMSAGLMDETGRRTHNAPPVTNTQRTQEKPMTFAIKIETKTFINGQEVSTISEEDFFNLIFKAEQEVERLDRISNKPKALQARKEQLTTGIMSLVNFLDSRS